MMSEHTRTAQERAEELLPTAEDIQEQFISRAMLTGFAYSRAEALRDWEAWREREQAARDAEPATDPELRAAVNALKDAAKSINVIVSTGIDLSPEELDLIDACASGAAQGWLMAQAARIEGDEA